MMPPSPIRRSARSARPSRPLRALLRCAALAAALAMPLRAQETPLLFRNARVFNGVLTMDRTDVLVHRGVIQRVGRGLRAPAGAQVVDATGKTLLPGLIDAHTHTFSVDALREAPVFGVTTHVDMFTDHRFARAMREEQAAGKAGARADLVSAGTLVTAPRGHGTQFGTTIPTITSPDSAQAFVDARIAEGSDFIKVVLDDGHAYGLKYGTLDRATLAAVVDAAHRRGKLAVVHVGDAASARTAIEVGADGLVHLFTDTAADTAFARLVRTKRAFVIPTMTVLTSITGTGGGAPLASDSSMARYLATASLQNLQQGFPRRAGAPALSVAVADTTIRRLRALGVLILAGSDAPNPGTWFGAAMHRELELLVAAGLSPAEALMAATSLPAHAFRLTDRGRIAAGKRADLLLVDGDPTADIRATRAISGVWKDGVPIERQAVAARIAEARKAERLGPVIPADGRISDFEQGQTASLGTWMPSADNIAGGTSTGELAVVEGGAGGSGHALAIRGTIAATVPHAWYGTMWSPGLQPMAPVDLSRREGFSFAAQGDGKTYRVMLFARSKGSMPLVRTFTAGAEWRTHAFAWRDFGVDGSDLMAIVFAGGPQPGAMSFRIDDVRLR
jgi:imidazolonepropionase-like amidohydrolase